MPEAPGFHDINIWIEKGLDAIDWLSKRVARAAWALETNARAKFEKGTFQKRACLACGSTLVPEEGDACPACGTPKEKKSDV